MKNLTVILVVGAAFIGGFLFATHRGCGIACAAPQAISVTPQVFAEYIERQSGSVLIDVRTPEEFAAGHMPGAINIDYNDKPAFERALSQLDPNSNYLIYCRSGNRSGQAMEEMRQRGFSRVINLSGGILDWQAAGL